ncbi:MULTISPECIES: dethiobiotin synthase [unclassified Acinetobacter]|uniref:dethiobiotin synthase n=1 Tax=unclassified Acinetobacter TaxID=196816 RepID=UPI002935238F|nr:MULTISPECIES: dethiobiotin synthase [unclassified Acinetobacter]WOE31363.1 dethiobiotin synthase [Acinetobacter sp. SAAs470]WOE39559.1 dethiobiotin synthase [Acinetobacter sp. SAAs474]
MTVQTSQVFFVSGIDTSIGKTYATGYLAKLWNAQGIATITQKLIQTGNVDISEDIEQHRQIMGTGWLDVDIEKLTMPEIFSYPASPHLATKLDGREIDFGKIEAATQQLMQKFDRVLLEGAGGLMVPLNEKLLTLDYVAMQKFPVILVSSGRLGSINHTLLSLEALKAKNIELYALAYNLHDESQDPLISNSTADYLKQYLTTHFPHAQWLEIPIIESL